jgi:hypothetical protein
MTDIRDQEYLKAEAQLEKRMAQLYQQVNEKKAEIRRNVDLTDEERQERFANWYRDLGKGLEDEASRFVATWDNLRYDLERQIHEGTGERFADHLTRVSEMPTEKLDELMATAQRTGQTELEQAVAEVALTRMRHGVFNKWAERNPNRAAAIARLHNLPETDRVISRANARSSVPNASFEALTPTEEDIERAASDKRRHEAERQRYLRSPKIKRQVGSRITEVPQ